MEILAQASSQPCVGDAMLDSKPIGLSSKKHPDSSAICQPPRCGQTVRAVTGSIVESIPIRRTAKGSVRPVKRVTAIAAGAYRSTIQKTSVAGTIGHTLDRYSAHLLWVANHNRSVSIGVERHAFTDDNRTEGSQEKKSLGHPTFTPSSRKSEATASLVQLVQTGPRAIVAPSVSLL